VRRALVTGGAGFIGSNLADRLAADGAEVIVYDNVSTGRREFVKDLLARSGTSLVEGDVLDLPRLTAAMRGCDVVFHLQANADVRFGLEHPRRDLEQNTIATANVLDAMRANEVERIVFSSTGSIYGEPEVFPTPEDCPFPVQTSLYGASKLAGEGMIAAHCHGYGTGAAIFRFVSILGERYTHGHVFDFYRALRRDPSRLTVLGDGRQEKSYLYVGDCVEGILAGYGAVAGGRCEIFNLGTDATLVVDDSVARICAYLGVDPEIEHTGGARGWAGDAPLIRLDCSRIRALGWEPDVTIEDAVDRTLAWFEANQRLVLEDLANV
jgi:UDP-glucose 4-epimerase